MKEKIEHARDFDDAIQIITEESCDLGVYALQFEFAERFSDKPEDTVIIPILNGGKRIGDKLPSGLKIDYAPMQMSYYDDKNQRLENPVCKIEPDINKIIVNRKTRNVVFAEGVVDSEGTIKKSIEIINTMIDKYNTENNTSFDYPEYHVFALVSKVNGNSSIPNFVYAFKVDNRIWVHGWGVDNSQKGREENNIFGILSPYADSVPSEPYVTESAFFNKFFRRGIIAMSEDD